MVTESGGARDDRKRSWAQRTASHDMSADAAAAAGIVRGRQEADRTPLAPKALFGAPPAQSPEDVQRTISEARRPAVAAQIRPPPASPAIDDDGKGEEPAAAAEEVVAGSANDGRSAPQHAVVISDIDGVLTFVLLP